MSCVHEQIPVTLRPALSIKEVAEVDGRVSSVGRRRIIRDKLQTYTGFAGENSGSRDEFIDETSGFPIEIQALTAVSSPSRDGRVALAASCSMNCARAMSAK